MKLIVKTFVGIEPLLAKELEQLGAANIEVQRCVVNCEGDQETLYKICYRSRLAVRVMVSLKVFPAADENDIYKNVRTIAWHDILKDRTTFCVDHVTFSQRMNDSVYIAQKVKDAIIDEMMEATGDRPYVNADDPDYMVNVHVTDERVSVSIDATGAPLDNRGYRPEGIDAATNEVLAAALVDLSGWQPSMTLIDPMCGAGTICIEAAMKARNIPAAFYRKYSFCFESFKDFDADLWKKVKDEADGMRNSVRLSIVGSDIDTDATDIAKTSTLEMRLTTDVRINRRSVREQTRMTQEGVVITCPPTDPDQTRRGLPDFYKEATYYLSHNFPDHDVWIYSTDADAMDAIPFDAERELQVRDGFFNLYPF
ncbi:MAG: THUMP domain-containing protein [Bacteroidales bacterium]|nr:THUMP domain-containing protein [Bacteroidales bacterium]MDY4175686.1 THUMP domain-containing protein [Bacteroidales bacterium]